MPKNRKETHGEFLVRVKEKYTNIFRIDDKDKSFLFCIFCEQKVNATRMSQVTQHLSTKTHMENGDKKKSNNLPQQSLVSDFAAPSKGPQLKEFHMDLCKMLIGANIPVYKVTHPSVVAFIEKHTKEKVPSDTTLRENYFPKLYNDTIEKLRSKVVGKKIWVSLDESTDVEHRMVANFVFGILGEENERGKSYLLNVSELSKTNANTIAVFFNESLLLLWPTGI